MYSYLTNIVYKDVLLRKIMLINNKNNIKK